MKNYGLIIPKIETREEGAEHLLGSIEKIRGIVINPLGDWTPYLPDKEPQNVRGIETNGCTIYGTLNAIETLIYFITGIRVDYSNRYLANLAKREGKLNPLIGADPHSILEIIRKIAGCLREEQLPDWTDEIKTSGEYYGLLAEELTELVKEGQRWYDEWELSHEWIWSGNPKPNEKRLLLQEGLTKGVIAISVSAWFQNEKGLYHKPESTTDNHWVQLISAPPLKYKVLDSYDAFVKELEELYNFAVAKVIYLTPAGPKLSLLEQMIKKIAEIISSLSLLVQKKVEPQPEPTPEPQPEPIQPKSRIKDSLSLLVQWALAIQKEEGFFEGSKSKRNNNPGNLKYSSLTASLGAINKDAGNFCIFKDYNSGFNALCEFLTLAAEDKLKPYRNARTLYTFTKVYAEPPDDNYAKNVARALGVSILTPIRELL